MKPEDPIDPQTIALWLEELEDGVIAEENRAALMQLMREREDVVDLYVQHSQMGALIHQAAESRVELGTMPVSPETLRREKRRSAWASLSYAAAAVVLLGAGLLFFQGDFIGKPPQVTIRLESSNDAKLAIVYGEKGERKGAACNPVTK